MTRTAGAISSSSITVRRRREREYDGDPKMWTKAWWLDWRRRRRALCSSWLVISTEIGRREKFGCTQTMPWTWIARDLQQLATRTYWSLKTRHHISICTTWRVRVQGARCIGFRQSAIYSPFGRLSLCCTLQV